jgi:hypothetical protein
MWLAASKNIWMQGNGRDAAYSQLTAILFGRMKSLKSLSIYSLALSHGVIVPIKSIHGATSNRVITQAD